jgi:3-isopropylmalate dehydrogenase
MRAMPSYRIVVLGGDGIGPEVMDEGLKVLRAVEGRLHDVSFETVNFPAGAQEYLRSGNALPDETFEACRSADAILLGAMGLPHVRYPNGNEIAPQLDLRERLELYAGMRPVRLLHADDTPLKGYRTGEIDFVLVRENTEGMFATRHHPFSRDADAVEDTVRITRAGAERVFRAAFRESQRRRRRVTLVDKSNVLATMAYFRSIFDRVSEEFRDVEADRVYIDACSLYFVQRPQTFDVVVTENLFGDILSDLAAGLVGGMGVAPSGDIGDRHAVFQPSHGSAPDIAGRGIANPTAMILSVAMMLDWLGDPQSQRGARSIEQAVEGVYADPAQRTPDLRGSLTTSQMGDAIVRALG